MTTHTNVIDNRVFLIGLDELYRNAMKRYEQSELLDCAREVVQVLGVSARARPVEGYYSDDPLLTEYFLSVRALQEVDRERASEVAKLPTFLRLEQVCSSPIFGRAQFGTSLLPAGRDPLSQALLDTRPHWDIPRLTAAACSAARLSDDISLVGLAARMADPVLLAAFRESVVLYAEMATLGMPLRPQYHWAVDEELAALAGRFIDAFAELFSERLPDATPREAERYWTAYENATIAYRCVCLGADEGLPTLHYHWAIVRDSNHDLIVKDFWHPEIWTTARWKKIGGGIPSA